MYELRSNLALYLKRNISTPSEGHPQDVFSPCHVHQSHRGLLVLVLTAQWHRAVVQRGLSWAQASSHHALPSASSELPSRPLTGLQSRGLCYTRESPQHSWTEAAATACTRAAHSTALPCASRFSNRNCGIFPLRAHSNMTEYVIFKLQLYLNFFHEGLSHLGPALPMGTGSISAKGHRAPGEADIHQSWRSDASWPL